MNIFSGKDKLSFNESGLDSALLAEYVLSYAKTKKYEMGATKLQKIMC